MVGKEQSEYDAWEHICADAFDSPQRGIVAMLTAYFDAAVDPTVKGRPNRPLLHSVGCWLGTVNDWRKFRRDWNKELKKGNPKLNGHFHMTDFEWALSQVIAKKPLPKDNPYYGWKRHQFIAFQKQLYKVLNSKRSDGNYRLVAFASSVHKAEFDTKLPDALKGDPECASYYVFNVANLMKGIAMWCNTFRERYKRYPVHYIFADGDKPPEYGNLQRWFRSVKDDPSDSYYFRLGKGYTSVFDMAWASEEPALQAADVATFELSKVGVEITARGHSNIPYSELRRSLPVLFQTSAYTKSLAGSEIDGAFDQIIGKRRSQKIARETNADPMLPPDA